MDGESGCTAAALRALYGAPSELSLKKQLTRLDPHCRRFIALSPFLVLATVGKDGLPDASPRGDAPGFVSVLDDETLLVPDRRGNNRLDSLQNISEQSGVGLIFFVPGINETLRVNGHARITTDAALLARFAVDGKVPRTGLLVAVKEVYYHCAKALIRAKLWDSSRHIARKEFPSLGRILADQIAGTDAAATEQTIAEGYRERLY
jgi:PPOX class probable FMN-dependent enzyme